MKEMVMSFSVEITSEMKKQLKEVKESAKKNSLSLDKWTSCGNVGQTTSCNIVFKCSHVYGVISINDSATASRIIQIIFKNSLEQFELDMKSDIVALVTDSAFVMKKIGRLLGITNFDRIMEYIWS
ncbi:hypothetical protein T10_12498 [Trichinella papuae]|uniref:Uncharacterized protein n=1 Tax=Trichinella papuae TaxID=268474 RepID=A0A0V1M467_9BILA|nr:hypothetical protein T10_10953 [Trichinella papuae]KRZ66711.1 hypothetical protein T10_12498 [Trichinella papuae]